MTKIDISLTNRLNNGVRGLVTATATAMATATVTAMVTATAMAMVMATAMAMATATVPATAMVTDRRMFHVHSNLARFSNYLAFLASVYLLVSQKETNIWPSICATN